MLFTSLYRLILCSLTIGLTLLIGQPEVFAQPVVNLGADTASCGPLSLDAGNPGATYLWSTTETTQTILASTSDTYWVDVTDVSGTTRDSIEVEIVEQPTAPVVNDTSVCGPGEYTLVANGVSDEVLWYEDAVGDDVFQIGESAQVSILNTTSFYYEALNFGIIDTLGLTDLTGFSLGYQANDRGQIFDVLQPSVLKSVSIYANAPGVMEIRLEDNGGTVLASKVVNVTVGPGQKQTVPLYFELPVGTDLFLVGSKISGLGSGLGFLNVSLPYPFEIPGKISLTSGSGFTNRWYYFYDWAISSKICRSPRDSVQISVLPAPLFELGNDTIVCGASLLLDASFPGSTYLWNTAETSSSIVATQSGTYTVDATLASCTLSDTILVEFVDEAVAPVINDTSVCGPGEYTLFANGPQDEVLWYESATGDDVFQIGESAQVSILSTTSFYYEALNFGIIDTLGLTDLTGFSLGYQANDRGQIFDVLQPSVLKSVSIYANAPGVMEIRLEDDGGTVLASKVVNVTVGPGQKQTVPLYFELPVGTDLFLVGSKVSGLGSGLGFLNASLPYPFEIPGKISITSGSGFTNRWYYFYDWAISSKICRSPRDSVQVTVLPAPLFELGNDTIVCGGSLLLDASFPGSTYLWSTAETSSSIVATQSGTYTVDATLASCTLSDTILVEFVDEALAPVVNDTSVCGPGEYPLFANGPQDEVLWYDSSTDGNLVNEGSEFVSEVTQTTTYYAEAVNFGQRDTIGLQDLGGLPLGFQGNDRGLIFDVHRTVIIKSVGVYADQPGVAKIRIENSGGQTIDSAIVNIPNGNGDISTVPVYFELEPGTDYRMMGTPVSGLGLGLGFLNSVPTPFPYESPDLISIKAANNGAINRYYYFFEWEVTPKICRSPRVPIQISVLPAPVVDFLPYTSACGDELTLDASNSGASYLWSTGETTSSISVTANDTFSVTTTIGSCATSDTTIVELVSEPASPIPNDTTVCGNGEVSFSTQTDADAFLWFTSATSSQFIEEADSLFQIIQDTTTFFVEGLNYSSILTVGKDNFNPATSGFQNNFRGVLFDVFQPLTLKSVRIYSDQPTEVTVLLTDEAGTPLDSVRTLIPGPVGKQVPLYFDLSPGNNYRLVGTSIVGGGLGFTTSNLTYPYEIKDEIQLKAAHNGVTSGYYYFFDWEILRKVCRSPRMPVTVTVALPLNLGPDLYSCDEVSLDAQNPSATYVWSTGATSQSIVANESGQYWVEIADGEGCTSTDSIEIIIPFVDLGDDGTICGTELITGYDSSSVFLWSTGDTTPDLSLLSPGTYWVQVQEPLGCTLEDTIVVSGFADFPTVELGPDFSSCDSATLDAGNPGLSFLWSTGDTSQSISVYASGEYEVEVTNEFSCTTTEEINVFVAQSPVAEFAYSVNGLTVFFENLSSLGTNFWTLGDGNTSNLISPIYTYSDTGTYTIQLIVVDILNNCGSDTFSVEITLTSTVGIEDLASSAAISIFPNPTREQVSLRIEQATPGAGRVKLTDLRGRMILGTTIQIQSSTHTEPIDLPDLPAGVYQVHVLLGQRRYVQQLMIY